MALKHAILAMLLYGDASGYELAKRFDRSVANFWHATPQQIYAELARMEQAGLVGAITVIQERRPNKRVFSLAGAGRDELVAWVRRPDRPREAIKDPFLVRVFAGELAEPQELLEQVAAHRARYAAKLSEYEALRGAFLAGGTEEEHIRTGPHPGVYLALKMGIVSEQARLAWCDWAERMIREQWPAQLPRVEAAADAAVPARRTRTRRRRAG